ncbi:MAG: hypothetical protein ACOYK6_02305 [Chthoniobacterales bacterium]
MQEIKKPYIGKISATSFYIIGLTLVIGLIWFLKGPSDQELLANMAKAEDFHPWVSWWSNNFMAGGSVAPELTTLFTLLPLKFFGFMLGPLLGGKAAGLLALACAGFAMHLFLGAWTQDQRAAFFGALAYMMGPQLSLRLGSNEHLPVVFSMVYAPLVLWSLWILVAERRWKGSLFFALSYGALLLTFSKMAVCLVPIALGFLLFLGYERRGELREHSLILAIVLRLLLAGLLLIPLAIIPLLPVLREYPWLALFTYEPFQDWQNNFVFQSSLAFLDRDCLLTSGMPPNFTLDHGGFYLGIVTILLTWYVFYSSKRREQRLGKIAQASFALILLSAWLSIGPGSLASRTLLFLRSAQEAQNIVIPLFWLSVTGLIFLVWRLVPSYSNEKWDKIFRTLLLLIFLFVPGFKLFELFPFAQGIRAPWSLWQLGGSLFLAALFGCAASLFVTSLREIFLQKICTAALLLLVMFDFSPYLFFYHQGALREGIYDDFLKTTDFLKQDSSHSSIMPFSGRYFYLQLPSLTGHPIVDEAFNRYFELKWVRSLGNSLNSTEFKELLNLLGASYIFIDKEDPTTTKQSQDLYRSFYPVAFENNSFLILENRSSLYPAFLARDFVVFPKESYLLAKGSLQLASMNLVTLEMTEANPRELGFAGVAKGGNQIELLPSYKDRGGAPFQHFDAADPLTDHDQKMTYQVPSAASGWFVVTKAFHPDWQGTVDGQPAKIYRAAGALLSLYIPLNSQEIVFKFHPPFWYTLSFYFGILSWFLALAFFFLIRSRWAPARWKEWWREE